MPPPPRVVPLPRFAGEDGRLTAAGPAAPLPFWEREAGMNHKRSAMLSAAAIVLIGYSILSADETPSRALSMLQYLFLALAVVGLGGSPVMMAKGKN